MKLNVFNRKKTALEKLTSTYDVKLDASASQLIMDVLAKLYDNPVEAAIREYVSNAYDANVETGSTEPIHLHVPTEDEPYLEVSDTGNGLDYLEIVSVFANFGTSTKRDSNEFIGGFGIGSKSGLAISDKIHYTKNKMDAYATTISDTIKPLLDNDNVAYLIKMFNINKQLANNIAMLNLDTKQDAEVYLKALYRTSRRCDPKTHNLSFDQKLFLAALVSNNKHLISKKDAAKIVKRLKLLFQDELKLIKDTADEIAHKAQL